MTGVSGASSEHANRILAQLVIQGPIRVEELQKQCASMSKRTFYLALKEAEKSGSLVRIRKSRKNVLVQLNPKRPEIRNALESYDQHRKLLGLYYTPNWERSFREKLLAARESHTHKEVKRLISELAWLLAISSVASLYLESNTEDAIVRVRREVGDLLQQRQRQALGRIIKEYDMDVKSALEAWLRRQVQEHIATFHVPG